MVGKAIDDEAKCVNFSELLLALCLTDKMMKVTTTRRKFFRGVSYAFVCLLVGGVAIGISFRA